MMQYNSKHKQKGFTLIELVVVIVILGILSAFALPRFLNLTTDARVAAIEGVAGSIKSASALVRAACLTDPNCAADETTEGFDLANFDGGGIDLENGFPAHSENGILRAASIDLVDGRINDRLSAVNTGTGEGALVIIADDAPNNGVNCRIVYSDPSATSTANGSIANTSGEEPEITVDTTDC